VFRSVTQTCFFYLISPLVQNAALPFWKLLAFMCQIKISEILLCLKLILHVTTVLPLDVLWWLMTSIGILVYSMESLFYLTVCKLIMLIIVMGSFFVVVFLLLCVSLCFICLCLVTSCISFMCLCCPLT
jgi:hypothetical protein